MTIGVTPVNDAPVGVADSISVTEGGTATVLVGGATSVLVNDSDVDSAILSAVLITGPAHGTLTLNANGTFSYTHDGSETTSDSFTYRANDGATSGNIVTVNIAVTPVNDAPQTNPITATGDEDTRITVVLTGSDVDGTVAGFVIKTLPANGTLYTDATMTTPVAVDTLVSGPVYFMPGANWNGSTSFTYAAQDNLGLVDATPATATITVNAVNDAPPVANDDPSASSYTFGLRDGQNHSWNNSFISSMTATGGTLLRPGVNGVTSADGVTGAIGVAGTGSTIELDDEIQNGEYITISLAAPVTSASFGYDKLDFTPTSEIGLWIAYLQGVEVGRGNFTQADATRKGIVEIKDSSGNAIAFDQIRFDTATTGSDYVVTWLTVGRTAATVQEGMSILVPASATSGVLANDSDTDGGSLTVASIRTGTETGAGTDGAVGVALQGTYGKLTLNADGSYSYVADDISTLNPGQIVKDYFTYTVSDGQGGSDKATLTISVFGATGVYGTSVNDTLTGTSSADLIIGGAGSDDLTGGLGADTFKWNLGDDELIFGLPSTDIIRDFSQTQGDVLQLSELLQGADGSNLTDYLHFTYDAAQNSTTVHISSDGRYDSGYNASATDQKIELKSVQLTGTDQDIINLLKSSGNLITD